MYKCLSFELDELKEFTVPATTLEQAKKIVNDWFLPLYGAGYWYVLFDTRTGEQFVMEVSMKKDQKKTPSPKPTKKKEKAPLLLHTDGSYHPKTNTIAYAGIYSRAGQVEKQPTGHLKLPHAFSHGSVLAEFLGLAHALLSHPPKEPVLWHSDSTEVICFVNMILRKQSYKQAGLLFVELIDVLGDKLLPMIRAIQKANLTIKLIPRKENQLADTLANKTYQQAIA